MLHRELNIHIGSDAIYIEGGGDVIYIDKHSGSINENPSEIIPTQDQVIRALGIFGIIKLPGKIMRSCLSRTLGNFLLGGPRTVLF